ncbi:MAG: RsmE family RNA methyltransferase [Coriobacteriia bacterium]|nr:RsmE family RNA methyltransferase [Coriobacteriia bacterium]
MSLHRFFLSEALPPDSSKHAVRLPLSAADVHHCRTVLRLRPDARIVVVAPDRTSSVVCITQLGAESVMGIVTEALPAVFAPRVTLIQGLAKGDKLDLIVEKVTEIGVEAVVPVSFARSVVKLDAERSLKRGERLRRVAMSAAKQSQRSFVPTISDPVAVAALPELLAWFDVVLVAWEEDRDASGIGAALTAGAATSESRIAIVVGPEGGLTQAEVDSLCANGALRVSLGSTVLRTETAGILSAALCVYECGGLGGRVRD